MSLATVLNNSSFINQTGHKNEVMIYAEGLYETENVLSGNLDRCVSKNLV
jgi:hypothetical protein